MTWQSAKRLADRVPWFLRQNQEVPHVRQSPTLFGILEALRKLTPHAKGHQACHRVSLAALICGIVGSKSSKLPDIANKTPGRAKRSGRITTWRRWLNNKKVTQKDYYLPYLTDLLQSLPEGRLVLVIDGSVVGRHCMALGWLPEIHRRTRCDLSCERRSFATFFCLPDPWIIRASQPGGVCYDPRRIGPRMA
jgi:hypothetical protein